MGVGKEGSSQSCVSSSCDSESVIGDGKGVKAASEVFADSIMGVGRRGRKEAVNTVSEAFVMLNQ